ncbi:LysR family transcriptional regulator ArgP [Nocardioides hwasunensis]|uniref:LysR family transcriptional regulator ArgP n=1 Tax=Nocardioides hwasunensis TaxID=397258 RepID=A0ABR8MAQ4_9ACTN|nr:LysR family transcriptional regulator ArgP [Nocardioides hwasunensis]MBD3913013.1 LysR family transcriptional regulator ArgP [Nocardioides hwasunensis]
MRDLTQIDPVALRTLAVAVRLGTFESAARELHVTPSAVSQRIKALETRVGRVLLHRVKPLEPTEAGLVLVRLSTQTELLEREAVAELVSEEDEDSTTYTSLPIAVNADALYGWFVDALAEVQSRHRVVFEVVREDHTRTAERLRRGEVVAAITGEPQPVPGCRVVRLGRLKYAAVATRAFHAAHFADGVGAVSLAEAPVVAFDRDDSLQHDFVRRVTRRHLAPPVTYVPSVREFDRAVRVGLGWGLLIESDVTEEIDRGDLVELVPGRRPEVPLFWQHWRLGSSLVTDLTDAVVDAARRWMAARPEM